MNDKIKYKSAKQESAGGWEDVTEPYLKAADDLEALADQLAAKIQDFAADQAALLRRKAYGLRN